MTVRGVLGVAAALVAAAPSGAAARGAAVDFRMPQVRDAIRRVVIQEYAPFGVLPPKHQHVSCVRLPRVKRHAPSWRCVSTYVLPGGGGQVQEDRFPLCVGRLRIRHYRIVIGDGVRSFDHVWVPLRRDTRGRRPVGLSCQWEASL